MGAVCTKIHTFLTMQGQDASCKEHHFEQQGKQAGVVHHDGMANTVKWCTVGMVTGVPDGKWVHNAGCPFRNPGMVGGLTYQRVSWRLKGGKEAIDPVSRGVCKR